jgi:hypothetical protein
MYVLGHCSRASENAGLPPRLIETLLRRGLQNAIGICKDESDAWDVASDALAMRMGQIFALVRITDHGEVESGHV